VLLGHLALWDASGKSFQTKQTTEELTRMAAFQLSENNKQKVRRISDSV
jgi:hypothetical protein